MALKQIDDEAKWAKAASFSALAWRVAGTAGRGVRKSAGPMSRFFCNRGIVFKVRLLLVFLIVLPAIGSLIALDSRPQDAQQFFVWMLVGGIILLAPLSRAISHFLVLRELRAVEEFCQRIKAGDYEAKFSLPPQEDEEHEILVLKRNLNWMAHVISRRELQLQEELAQTHEDRKYFASISMLDPLTGLYNRRALEEWLVKMAPKVAVTGRPLTMMFLDADKFKSVNDIFGHQVGDELLKNLGRILRCHVREHVDVPFRYGGDEFGVLLVGIETEQAAIIGERILRAYNDSRVGETTLSIGIAGFHGRDLDHKADMVRLLAEADRAAYEAKRRGGNCVYILEEKEE
jgi:diguanylate cyclase (GGDEF)-like protein